jgi:hypothetical protein
MGKWNRGLDTKEAEVLQREKEELRALRRAGKALKKKKGDRAQADEGGTAAAGGAKGGAKAAAGAAGGAAGAKGGAKAAAPAAKAAGGKK